MMQKKREEICKKAKLLEGDFISKISIPFNISNQITRDSGDIPYRSKQEEKRLLKNLSEVLLIDAKQIPSTLSSESSDAEPELPVPTGESQPTERPGK